MIVLGRTQDKSLALYTISKRVLYAILDLIREPIAQELGHDDWGAFQDDFIASIECLELDELPKNAFNLAYKLIMSSQDNLIKPDISDLKPLFESDPRFQAA